MLPITGHLGSTEPRVKPALSRSVFVLGSGHFLR